MTITYVKSFLSEFFDGIQTLIGNVIFQKAFELTDSIGNSGNQLIHPTQVLIFVSIKQILKFWMENLQVFLNENLKNRCKKVKT